MNDYKKDSLEMVAQKCVLGHGLPRPREIDLAYHEMSREQQRPRSGPQSGITSYLAPGTPVPFGRRSRPWLREREGPIEDGRDRAGGPYRFEGQQGCRS